MAGLEVLYTYVASSIDCPQDAIVCFVHWEMIKSGYRCIGSGDEARSSDKMTELLPADWSNNKELYSLRYEAKETDKQLLLKAVVVSSTMIFNLMNSSTQQVSDLTVNIYDHLDTDQLHSFDRVFRDTEGLSQKVRTQLLPSEDRPTGERTDMKSQREKEHKQKESTAVPSAADILPRDHTGRKLIKPDPMFPLFEAGGADLDPLASHSRGGMIVDPIRSGYPHSGFEPSSGIPDLLPPGAVPPGARFDPFGPIGLQRPDPDADPMPQPGYDDMFI